MSGRAVQAGREVGAALVSALLIVGIMSVTAIAVLDSINMATRVSVNVADRNQAELYAIGAESLAAAELEGAIATRGGAAQRMLDELTRQPLTFPLEDGQLHVLVQDGANCFNLNAVVEEASERATTASSENIALFAALLESLGIVPGESESLANALADWIDTDSAPRFGGAEDDYYGGLDAPYRTPGQFIMDVSELHLIRGYTPELVAALEPLVCARPSTALDPLNINALQEGELPLLETYLGDEINVYQAEELLLERPVGGYGSAEDVFETPVLVPFNFAAEIRDRIAVASERYDLQIRVDYRRTSVGLSSALVVDGSGRVATETRRYGAPR